MILNKRRRLSGKAGFTLVEMIVTLVITIIIIGISGSLIITSTNIFSKSALRDQQTNLAETVLTFVSDQFLYARDIKEYPSTAADYDTIIATAAIIHIKSYASVGGANPVSDTKGQLFYRREGDTGDAVNVFGKDFYHNYAVSIEYVIVNPRDVDADGNPIGEGTPTVDITVKVFRSGTSDLLVERSTTKPLLNYVGESNSRPAGSSDIVVIIHRH